VLGAKSLALQQKSVVSYALANGLEVDKEVVEHSSKNRPVKERKQFEEFMHSMRADDNLIISEIWTLSSRVDEIVEIICCTMSRKVNLHVATQRVLVTKETQLGQVLPLLNKDKDEMHEKRVGIGRPKGSKSHSKFDVLQPEILQMLRSGLSVSAIARKLNISRSSLKDYIESRSLKELIDNTFITIKKPLQTDIISEEVLICPFEYKKTKLKGVG